MSVAPKRPPRAFGLTLLILLFLACGVMLRATEPMAVPSTAVPPAAPPAQTAAVSTRTQAETRGAKPHTAAPTQATTQTPGAQLVLTDATYTPAPTTAAAVSSPNPSPTGAQPARAQTLPPGEEPDYRYVSDTLRIEITKYNEKNLVYFAAEVWLSDVSQFGSAFSSDRFDSALETVSDIADRAGAILAVNGDFATFNNGGIIIRSGTLYRANRSTRQLLLIDGQGDFIPYTDPPENAEEAAAEFLAQGILHTLVFGPVLVADGEAVPLPKNFFVNTGATVEPRTAVAQMGPLHYLVLVVDGRQDGYSRGVSLTRLQEILLAYGGVQTAFNLDGGGSTTLYYKGNILNQPANGGQRKVPDILFFTD